jgi:hypothetical protein
MDPYEIMRVFLPYTWFYEELVSFFKYVDYFRI